MNILNFDIKNCYGIGSLQHEIDYSQASVGVIYAPNGTMKTSLTKTFQRLIDGKNPCDEIYTHRESSAKIQLDGNPITHDSVYIFSNEEKDGTTQISTFLVNAELKLQYDAILSQITLAKSTDCESEIIETFQDTPDDTFFDCLLHIQQLIESNAPYINDKSFRYNDLFDKGHKVEQFVKENIDDILQYFDKYVQLLEGSSLFSVGENSFGTAQVSTLLKSVSDNRFFAASHKFLLHNENTISSKDDMQEVIDNELNKIYSDDTIKKLFEKIDKKLQANADLRNFQDVIQSNQDLIPELIDYDALRKKILLGYIISAEASFSELVGVYSANIDSIKTLIAQANETRSQWEFVIDIFNSRFFVPFKLKLQNKADILLNQVAPELIFVYKDGADGPIPQERKVLLEHLSKGEKHAFFILQNLFELEARKAIGKPTLIVFDDVADSFDYKNKYAIIEYLSDIANESLFTMLILTHNFDFYRSIVSRLNVGGNVFVANKNVSREVSLKQGLYRSDLLKCRIIDKLNTKRAFISCIPFARNIIEYTQGDSEDFKLLTSCLHIKDNTDTISINSIKDIFIRTLAIKQQVKEKINYDDDELYLSAVYDEANKIMLDDNEIELTNKLVLSIAIRLKAEQYMKSVLTIEQLNEMKKNSNQTGELVKLFKKHHIQTLENNCHIMNQVLMLTSENIHINNFMFEPLVDISILYLKDLYRKIQALTE